MLWLVLYVVIDSQGFDYYIDPQYRKAVTQFEWTLKTKYADTLHIVIPAKAGIHNIVCMTCKVSLLFKLLL